MNTRRIVTYPLFVLQTGALSRLTSLKTLYISTYEDVDHFNIPRILERNNALENLHIDVSIFN